MRTATLTVGCRCAPSVVEWLYSSFFLVSWPARELRVELRSPVVISAPLGSKPSANVLSGNASSRKASRFAAQLRCTRAESPTNALLRKVSLGMVCITEPRKKESMLPKLAAAP